MGDSIAITAQVNNQSNKRVRAIRVKLHQIINNHRMTVGVPIFDRNVQATGSFDWNGQLPVSVLGVSMNIATIRVSFILEVTVVVSFARNVIILLPVKIIYGTKSLEAVRSYATSVLGPMMQQSNPPGLPGYPLPPPECQLPPEMTTWAQTAGAPQATDSKM